MGVPGLATFTRVAASIGSGWSNLNEPTVKSSVIERSRRSASTRQTSTTMPVDSTGPKTGGADRVAAQPAASEAATIAAVSLGMRTMGFLRWGACHASIHLSVRAVLGYAICRDPSDLRADVRG